MSPEFKPRRPKTLGEASVGGGLTSPGKAPGPAAVAVDPPRDRRAAPGQPPLETPPVDPLFARRWWLIVGVVAGLGFLLAAGGRPVYQALRTWRAHSLAAAAEALMRHQNWSNAIEKAQAAYQLSPQDPQTLRSVARLCTALEQREALVFWHNLVLTGQATSEDRLQFGQVALRLKEFSSALEQLEWLSAHAAEGFGFLKFAAEYYFAKGEFAKAKHACRRAWLKQRDDPDIQLLLARLLARSIDVADQVEARQMIRRLSVGTAASSLEALRLLGQLRNLPREDAEMAADRLLAHPLAKTEEHLIAAGLRLRWHPEQREALLTGAIARFGKSGDADLVLLARWLNAQDEFQRTLKCVSLETSLHNQDLFLVRLDALSALGNWPEIGQILEQTKTPLEPVLHDLFRARVAKELGHSEQAALHWRRVHLDATDKPGAWLYIAQYAERIGDKAEAAKAWRRLTQVPNLARVAYQALIRLAEAEGNTRALRELLKEMAQVYTAEPEPQNDVAYLNLLLNENQETAKQVSLKLVQAHPNFLAYRTTLALAHFRLNDFPAAAAVYEGINLDWASVLPGWQAVRVAVLGATGKTNLARVAARRIPLDGLKPEEKALVEPYL